MEVINHIKETIMGAARAVHQELGPGLRLMQNSLFCALCVLGGERLL
jgi:hypothetical protein